SRDTDIVSAFSADDAGAMSAVTVLVCRVASVVDGIVSMLIVNDSQIIITVLLNVCRTCPDVVHQVYVVVINSTIKHGNNNLVAARRSGPSTHRTDVCAFLAAVVTVVRKRPLFSKPRILRVNMLKATPSMIQTDL